MRRYSVDVNGRTFVIDVEERARDRFRVRVERHDLEVTLTSAEDIAEAVITPGIAPPRTSSHAAPYRPPPPESLPAVLSMPRPPLPPAAPAAGPELVTTPMPGTVTGVLVEAGDRVERGDTLVQLEAMKMINAIKAPRDGVVAEVLVQTGEQVRFGSALVRLADTWVPRPDTME